MASMIMPSRSEWLLGRFGAGLQNILSHDSSRDNSTIIKSLHLYSHQAFKDVCEKIIGKK